MPRSRWSARCSIKGEPGTGKTVLADEVAKALGAPLITGTSSRPPRRSRASTSTTRCPACATASSATSGSRTSRNYIKHGKLWEAFERRRRPVLLIDEIDKADIEFPNDLLQELDRMEFYVYETNETIKAKLRPIVIITSNNEKELPDAFLRRCFFHYIRFPDAETMDGSSTCTIRASSRSWSPKRCASSTTCARCRV